MKVMVDVLNEIFLERGSVDEALVDITTTFCTEALKRMLDGGTFTDTIKLPTDQVVMG